MHPQEPPPSAKARTSLERYQRATLSPTYFSSLEDATLPQHISCSKRAVRRRDLEGHRQSQTVKLNKLQPPIILKPTPSAPRVSILPLIWLWPARLISSQPTQFRNGHRPPSKRQRTGGPETEGSISWPILLGRPQFFFAAYRNDRLLRTH